MNLFWITLIVLASMVFVTNLVGIFMACKDKNAAIKGAWRIPEATLMLVAVLGGSVAMYVTMRVIRHKTKRKKFMWGIPCIIFLQVAVVIIFTLAYWFVWR